MACINRCVHGIMSLARGSVHGIMLSQSSAQWLNDMPCAGKRVNDIMPCTQRNEHHFGLAWLMHNL